MGLRRSPPRPALKGSGGAASLLALPLLLLGAAARPGWALQNVTAPLFGAEAFGTLAAFGDFNSDKQTDLFVLRGGGEGRSGAGLAASPHQATGGKGPLHRGGGGAWAGAAFATLP